MSKTSIAVLILAIVCIFQSFNTSCELRDLRQDNADLMTHFTVNQSFDQSRREDLEKYFKINYDPLTNKYRRAK